MNTPAHGIYQRLMQGGSLDR